MSFCVYVYLRLEKILYFSHREMSLRSFAILSLALIFLFIFVKEERKGYWRLGGEERNDSCGNDVESEARHSFQRQLHRRATHIG